MPDCLIRDESTYVLDNGFAFAEPDSLPERNIRHIKMIYVDFMSKLDGAQIR